MEDAGARVIVNGEVTDRVDIGKPVRQGDPLAPALYILLTDYFIHCINQDSRVKGLIDPRGRQQKISGLADDTLLALLPLARLIEAALEIVWAFSVVSGCKVNWRKTKYMCVWVTVIPVCSQHILRVTGDESHPYLGLPFQEGDENNEVGRQICLRFIKKARALNVLALSLPARVLAINHILTASLWYFLFAWAPSPAEFKRLQNIITNFLWGKMVEESKGCTRVTWKHLIQPKREGGFGLVDPSLKALVLHGQWLTKALSPTDYP